MEEADRIRTVSEIEEDPAVATATIATTPITTTTIDFPMIEAETSVIRTEEDHHSEIKIETIRVGTVTPTIRTGSEMIRSDATTVIKSDTKSVIASRSKMT
jgi:hypothetical protein